MVSNYSLSYHSINLWVLLIKHDENKIETRQEGVRQTNILSNGLIPSILTIYRISSRNNTAACIQSGVNASLGNRHCLLLHDLVNRYSIDIIHFVELINADYASICEDHSTSF